MIRGDNGGQIRAGTYCNMALGQPIFPNEGIRRFTSRHSHAHISAIFIHQQGQQGKTHDVEILFGTAGHIVRIGDSDKIIVFGELVYLVDGHGGIT